jgi:hypothetical protein
MGSNSKQKSNKKGKKIKNAGDARPKINLNKYVSTKDNQCASHIDNLGTGICSSPNIVVAMVKYNEKDNNDTTTTNIVDDMQNAESITDFIKTHTDVIKNEIESVKKKLKCDNEMCIVTNPEFNHFAIHSHIVNKSDLNENINTRFKPEGPRNNTDWLSNEDIDSNLQDWACEFEDFFPCPFAMIDFNTTNDDLNKYKMHEIYSGQKAKSTILGKMTVPCRTFGCAINTDVSSGKGIHWMALFIDMRPQNGEDPWTIEFFNSAANPPQDSINAWMDAKKIELEEYLKDSNRNNKVILAKVHKLEHQMSSTECGVYTLFYIRSRLENIPYAKFLQEVIPDESMKDFRKHCFR